MLHCSGYESDWHGSGTITSAKISESVVFLGVGVCVVVFRFEDCSRRQRSKVSREMSLTPFQSIQDKDKKEQADEQEGRWSRTSTPFLVSRFFEFYCFISPSHTLSFLSLLNEDDKTNFYREDFLKTCNTGKTLYCFSVQGQGGKGKCKHKTAQDKKMTWKVAEVPSEIAAY